MKHTIVTLLLTLVFAMATPSFAQTPPFTFSSGVVLFPIENAVEIQGSLDLFGPVRQKYNVRAPSGDVAFASFTTNVYAPSRNVYGGHFRINTRAATELTYGLLAVVSHTDNTKHSIYGAETVAFLSGTARANNLYGIRTRLNLTGTTTLTGYAAGFDSLLETVPGVTVPTFAHLYGNNLVGLATNPYFLWYDGGGSNCDASGVYRVNHLGISAYYNPCFQVYTPGLANFERIINRWGDTGTFGTDNVAYIGVEAGGTGTNRHLQLIGGGLSFSPSLVTPAQTGTRFLCISTTGVVRSSVVPCKGT